MGDPVRSQKRVVERVIKSSRREGDSTHAKVIVFCPKTVMDFHKHRSKFNSGLHTMCTFVHNRDDLDWMRIK